MYQIERIWDNLKFWVPFICVVIFMISSFLDIAGVSDLGWGPR
jgi:hypothetical protein